jgi:hypothetical protein
MKWSLRMLTDSSGSTTKGTEMKMGMKKGSLSREENKTSSKMRATMMKMN